MRYPTVVKGGTIVSASDSVAADVAIRDGKIAAIGIDLEGDEIIDAKGHYVIPGGIDVHTHLDMPFGGTTTADDFETGTRAAACGGTTTIIDFAIQQKGEALRHGLDTWHGKAEGKAAIDYAFHMICTELGSQQLKEMNKVVDAGVTSFKLFMAYPGIFMVDDATIFRAMLQTGENGGMICMHAENGGVIDVLVERALAKGQTEPKYHALTRPMTAEAEATRRAIARPTRARTGVMVRPMAVTICQNWAVPGWISSAELAAASTISVVSDGLAIRMPVSAAVDRRAPIRRKRMPVTSALKTRTPTTAVAIEARFSQIVARSMLIPTVMRKIPSARPLKGSMIASTSP